MQGKEYPRVMYHAIHPPRLVESARQEEALGPDWARLPVPPPPPEPARDPLAALAARVAALERAVFADACKPEEPADPKPRRKGK